MNLTPDIDWQFIASGPAWIRHLVGVIASLTLFSVLWYFFIMPVRSGNQATHQQIMTAQILSDGYRRQLATLPLAEQLIDRVQRLKEQHQPHRYRSSLTAKLTQQVTDYVKLSGGQLIDLKRQPTVSDEDAGFIVYRWQLNIKASYFQFFEFIQLINKGTRLFTIENLTMVGEAGRLNLTISLSLYQLNMED